MARYMTEREKTYLTYSVFDFFASEIFKCPVFNVFGVFTYLTFFIQILKCLVFNVFGVFTYLRFFKILKCPVFSVFGVFTYLRFFKISKCPVFSVFGVFTYLRFYKISKWLVTHILLLVIALPGHHQGDVQAGSSSATDSGAMLSINITRQHLVYLSQCYSPGGGRKVDQLVKRVVFGPRSS